MGSALLDICDALAAVAVSFSADGIDYVLPGTPLAEVQDYVPVLPARLILPPGAYGQGVSDYQYVSFGNAVKVTWNIVDMMLFEAVGLGQMIGLKYQALAAYVAAYVPAVNASRKLAPGAVVSRITPNVGIIEYPRGSERFYNGVQMVVSVDETIC